MGCSYDTVVKTVKGEVHAKVLPSYENMTDEMLDRKHIVDRIVSLEEIFEVQDVEQLGYYATLLRFMGYTKEHLRILFPNMSAGWIHSRYFAGNEWINFDYKLLGIAQEQWDMVFASTIKKLKN